jgi:hypothetical protein
MNAVLPAMLGHTLACPAVAAHDIRFPFIDKAASPQIPPLAAAPAATRVWQLRKFPKWCGSHENGVTPAILTRECEFEFGCPKSVLQLLPPSLYTIMGA